MFMAFGSPGSAWLAFLTHRFGAYTNPSLLPGGRRSESGVYANRVETTHDVKFLWRRDH